MAQLGSDLDKLKQNAESMGRGKQGKGAADGGAGELDDIPEEEMQFDDDEQKQMDGDLTTIKEEDGEETVHTAASAGEPRVEGTHVTTSTARAARSAAESGRTRTSTATRLFVKETD